MGRYIRKTGNPPLVPRAVRLAQIMAIFDATDAATSVRVVAAALGLSPGYAVQLMQALRNDGKLAVIGTGRHAAWQKTAVAAQIARTIAERRTPKAVAQIARNRREKQRSLARMRSSDAVAKMVAEFELPVIKRLVPAGQWKAEPLRCQNSIFACGSAA